MTDNEFISHDWINLPHKEFQKYTKKIYFGGSFGIDEFLSFNFHWNGLARVISFLGWWESHFAWFWIAVVNGQKNCHEINFYRIQEMSQQAKTKFSAASLKI